MSSQNGKYSSNWFYHKVFGEESIRPRFYPDEELLPSTLRAARSLEVGMPLHAQSRSALFIKQGKLLANYEDDCPYEKPVLHYFPTYQSLSDPELRGYFTWRTRLRKGQPEATNLSYAFLYLYELINLIGVSTPEEGFEKLCEFKQLYGEQNQQILHYMNRWMQDFAVYYRLDPSLLADTPPVIYNNSVAVFAKLPDASDAQILEALGSLSPSWLKRSRFYRQNREDMDQILVRVLRKVDKHYATTSRPMVAQYFGRRETFSVRLFDGAIFHDRNKKTTFEYRPDNSRIYRCKHGVWTLERNGYADICDDRLNDLLKTVDAVMRPLWNDKHPIQMETTTKWLLKQINEECAQLLAQKEAARNAQKTPEPPTVALDFSLLESIRQDAAITRDKLIVEEEDFLLPEVPEVPEAAPTAIPQPDIGCPLPPAEYRLLQSLLYGGDLNWVRQEGLMLSVLTDSCNEALFDIFSDTVLTSDEPPELIEDYIDDLKEMVKP